MHLVWLDLIIAEREGMNTCTGDTDGPLPTAAHDDDDDDDDNSDTKKMKSFFSTHNLCVFSSEAAPWWMATS